jgi:uncharacterized protein YdhG (YjbR/CyaY superfamily)
MNKAPQDVDEYIESQPAEVREKLQHLRDTIRRAAPEANERISYGMPFYEYGGTGFKGRLIYFGVSKNYVTTYIPPSRAGKSLEKLKKYQSSVSAFHFALNKPIPFTLIDKAVREMVRKTDGV